MPMVVVITRDVEDRYRGFLGSVMLELSVGVYAHPRMSAGVRGRIWEVLADWHRHLHQGSIVMTWADSAAHGGLGLATLGEPPKQSSPMTRCCWCAGRSAARRGAAEVTRRPWTLFY